MPEQSSDPLKQSSQVNYGTKEESEYSQKLSTLALARSQQEQDQAIEMIAQALLAQGDYDRALSVLNSLTNSLSRAEFLKIHALLSGSQQKEGSETKQTLASNETPQEQETTKDTHHPIDLQQEIPKVEVSNIADIPSLPERPPEVSQKRDLVAIIFRNITIIVSISAGLVELTRVFRPLISSIFGGR